MKPYYEHKGITIFHADCREVLPSLSDVDLVFTSPPYNLGNTSASRVTGDKWGHYGADAPLSKRGGGASAKWSGGSLVEGYGECSDDMPHEEYVIWQKEVVMQCWNALRHDGAVFYNHKQRVIDGEVVLPTAYLPPLPIRQIVVWSRAGGVNFSPAFYCPTHEWIIIMAKLNWRLRSRGASGVGDVWRIPQGLGTEHPAPFPVALPARAIETTGARLVVDPFCGSGSTLVAAKNAGVRAVGIEISERWCELAAMRLSQEVLFGGHA